MSKNKIVSIILLLILAVMSLSACDAGQIKIEDYEWKMRTVMRNDTDLSVPAVGEQNSAHPYAKVVDLRLMAKDG